MVNTNSVVCTVQLHAHWLLAFYRNQPECIYCAQLVHMADKHDEWKMSIINGIAIYREIVRMYIFTLNYDTSNTLRRYMIDAFAFILMRYHDNCIKRNGFKRVHDKQVINKIIRILHVPLLSYRAWSNVSWLKQQSWSF